MSRYSLRGGQAGYERLLLLARERRADTLDLLARAGVGPGMRCLDVGCGAGTVSRELARLVGPGGTVLGVDLDEAILMLASRDAAEAGLDNVTFEAADVTTLPTNASYDVVYSRFLLQHLSDPVGMLRRMWAVVGTGGRLIIEDADFDGCFSEPAEPGFEFFLRLYPMLLARRGGDASIGRRLHRHFRAAGIPSPSLRAVNSVHAAGDEKTLRLVTLQAVADALRVEGLASATELADAEASLASFIADPDTVIGGPQIFQAWSMRPADPRP